MAQSAGTYYIPHGSKWPIIGSVALFLFILLSWYMGWVKPTGLPVGT